MPLDVTASFEEQYAAIRSGRALVELIDWSSVTLAGNDRHAFLHNFCTNDVKRLAPGDCCEAFFTSVKGKIIAHGLITCSADELSIIGVPGQAARLLEHLDRYLIRENVQLRDTTAERACMLVTGEALPTVFRWNLVGNESAGICSLPPTDLPAIWQALETEPGVVVAGGQAFHTARIEGGMPLLGIDFDDNNLPQEVGRDRQAISFTKGCYLGQETVARIDALGHVNQRIVGVRFFTNSVPATGTELSLDGKLVGRVTSATHSPQLRAPLALGMVRRAANSPGTRLDSIAGPCEVIALPAADAT